MDPNTMMKPNSKMQLIIGKEDSANKSEMNKTGKMASQLGKKALGVTTTMLSHHNDSPARITNGVGKWDHSSLKSGKGQ